jgi:hypothetical protein
MTCLYNVKTLLGTTVFPIAPFKSAKEAQQNKDKVINIVLAPRHSTHFASWAVVVAEASWPAMVEVVEALSSHSSRFLPR